MSIRLTLLIGGLILTLTTVIVGGLSIQSQRYGNTLADRVFDDGLVPLDRLAATLMLVEDARTGAIREVSGGAADAFRPTAQMTARLADAEAMIRSVLNAARPDDDPAFHGVLTEAASRLNRLQIPHLALSGRLFVHEIGEVAHGIGRAISNRRATTSALREAIDRQAEESVTRTGGLIAVCVLFSLLVTLLLARAVAKPFRQAVAVAETIASGRLDTPIPAGRRGEIGALWAALQTVQTSIAEQFERIEEMRRRQATSYVETITLQNARFQAALDNMSQGLCLFDRDLNLVVHNRRFEEMFGAREIGLSPERSRQDPYLRPALASTASGTFVETMPDGRIIALSRRGVIGGGFVVTMEDITERYHEDEIMRHLARHDALTDLPNRMQFRDHLEHTLSQTGATVLGLDLDGFKTVNDTLGHPVGDQLLQAVAVRLREEIQADAVLARIGGDEFAVVLDGTLDTEAARHIASHLIAVLGRPFVVEGHELTIGVSIGIASHETSQASALADEVIMHVDLALYAAKAEGKNTFRFFQRTMSERLMRRRELEIDLRAAVDRDEELELFYQPFIEAANGTISGFEALLRWRHPVQGMISPGEFVPIAEDVGLIHRIGLWALRSACLEANSWPNHLSLSVNLSPVQFRNERLLEEVFAIVVETGIDPRRLQLEVTESLMLENPDEVLATLNAFRDRGICISMDDFGTGYSSLGYLTRYPFDKVKIDQSFVRDMHVPQNLAVIRSIISLCGALGMSAIAEGVETETQYAMLRAEGCPEMQGYHFSRPVPSPDIPPLVLKTFAAALTRSEPVRPVGVAAA